MTGPILMPPSLENKGLGARPQADQALAVPVEPASGLAPTGFDPSRKLFINGSEVVGTLAMWAVRQSPYPVPDGLEAALQAVHDRLPDEFDGWFWVTHDELYLLVNNICLNEPEVVKWNTPRSGHTAEFVFSSRYDRPSPDDDIIDLHALAGNVCRSLIADQYSDSDGSPEGGDALAAPFTTARAEGIALTCPMCTTQIDPDTKVCPSCKEPVA